MSKTDRAALLPALAALSLLACATPTDSQVLALDSQSEQWNAPVEPFAIADGLYYVGAANVSSFLFVTDDGLILLDTGFAQTAPQIIRNIRTLGHDVADVRIIITSQVHSDHVGAVAEIARLSGAQIVMSQADAALAARGGRGDFAFGDRFFYPPFTAGRTIADGDTVSLGGHVLTAHITPGHTQGCTTWSTTVRAAGVERQALFICGVSAPGYDLVDNAAYPNIVGDYRTTFERLSAMPCEIVLGPHGDMFDLAVKHQRLLKGDANAFYDPEGCRTLIETARERFEVQLARQSAPQN
jgi:metallo-beta-lactamase class B